MLHKTRGIILHSVAYSDTYKIIPVYTEEFGLISYLVANGRSKKSRNSQLLFQPLSVLDLEVEHYPLRNIHKIKEAKRHILLPDLSLNPLKSSICLFLSEFIYNISKDVQSNCLLFDFILESLQILDLLEVGIANFHLVFMIRVSRFLGFYPNVDTFVKGTHFDLQDGVFTRELKPFHLQLNVEESQVFFLLLKMNYQNMVKFRFSRHDRIQIINRILEFYRFHLTSLPEMKSLPVLQDIFN